MLRPTPRLSTVPEDWQTAVAIVAHPDDMEYGAASAVAKWTAQGKRVVYVMVSKGEAGIDGMHPSEVSSLRAQEEINSARVVGVETVEFLDHTDGIIEYGLPLRRDLSRVIRRHQPDIVITINHHLQFATGHLNMADHRWVGLAVFDAARDAGNRWIFPELLEEGLEPWNEVRFVVVFGATEPTHAVDVSDSWETGLDSLREHKVYLENLGDVGEGPFEFLSMHARTVGQAFGCQYASQAELVYINYSP
jgi:LmbE family N-acetylglucosaminyl deacetylase